ncbi:MAG: type 4b pilus protein PilO2 [Alphaproteobacteria bacterium]|nr:type 4b pilus protein PilO2 [Alphaproteobacteria bacterium]
MTSGVVTVGRQRYAVGLYWENSPGGGRVAQIAREAANQAGQQAEFYAVRPGSKNGRIPQFGLSGGGEGQTSGMPVLAACLAGQIPGSWAGAFRFPGGIAVIIVRDDLIVPDGDLLFTDENEARNRLIQEIGFGGLQATYAPESWSIPGVDTIPLTLLLNERKDIKLQPVKLSDKLKLILAGSALAFILLVGGVWYWQQKTAEEEAAREAQLQAMRLAQMRAHQMVPSLPQQPPQPKYERYWEQAPRVMAVIDACARGMSKTPVAAAGWTLISVHCNGTSITLNWARGAGPAAPPHGANVNDLANAATQSIPLGTLTARGAQQLDDPKTITDRYLAQNWPGQVVPTVNDPPPPPPPNYQGTWNPPPPPWVKRSFTLHVAEFPSELPSMIGTLPGVIVNDITYTSNGDSSSWSIEGVIYANRK